MGGRGSSSGVSNGGGKKTSPATSGGSRVSPSLVEESPSAIKALSTKTKYTKEQISKMSRKKLEAVATAVFIKYYVAKYGLSPTEAERRIKLLMNAQTTPQLRRDIKKYG